jgi:hypothetical protein
MSREDSIARTALVRSWVVGTVVLSRVIGPLSSFAPPPCDHFQTKDFLPKLSYYRIEIQNSSKIGRIKSKFWQKSSRFFRSKVMYLINFSAKGVPMSPPLQGGDVTCLH